MRRYSAWLATPSACAARPDDRRAAAASAWPRRRRGWGRRGCARTPGGVAAGRPSCVDADRGAAVGQQRGALDHVLQLAHVAGPGVGAQCVARGAREVRAAGEEVLGERQHVVDALGERRQVHLDHVDAVVEVFAERCRRAPSPSGRRWSRSARAPSRAASGSSRGAGSCRCRARAAASSGRRAAGCRSRRGTACRRRPRRSGPRAPCSHRCRRRSRRRTARPRSARPAAHRSSPRRTGRAARPSSHARSRPRAPCRCRSGR